jgi:hypothetical protein
MHSSGWAHGGVFVRVALAIVAAGCGTEASSPSKSSSNTQGTSEGDICCTFPGSNPPAAWPQPNCQPPPSCGTPPNGPCDSYCQQPTCTTASYQCTGAGCGSTCLASGEWAIYACSSSNLTVEDPTTGAQPVEPAPGCCSGSATVHHNGLAYCNPVGGGPTPTVCESDQDCAEGNSAYPSCAPEYDAGVGLLSAPSGVSTFYCVADDGQPYDGCAGTFTTCSGVFDCWTIQSWSASSGNNGPMELCALSCNVDADCNQPGVACCDTTGVACSNDVEECDGNGACNNTSCAGACLPCGSF